MFLTIYTAVIETVPIWLMWTLFILSAVYLYLKWKPNYWEAHGVPSVRLGWIRVIRLLIKRTPVHELDQIVYNSVDNKYKMFGTHEIGHPYSVVVRDPDLLKDLLIKDFNYFTDRRDATKMFSEKLKGFPKCCPFYTDTFFNVYRTFRAFTWDLIATCAFSTKVNTEQDPNSDFARHTRNMIDRDLKMFNLILLMLSPKLAKRFNLDLFPHEPIEYYTQLASEMIKKRKTNPELQKPTDFLQLMIDAENDEIGNGVDDKKKVLTTELITAQAIMFFFAGSDTVASTLMFIPYFMALNSDCQDRLIAELDSVLKKHNGEITYEALQEMLYMDMVIAEAQRLYPVSPRLERLCTQDHHIGGVPVKKGTIVVVPIYAIQRDDQNFSDPEKFDPERFSNENKSDINPFTNMPFGMGPRNCIGNRFALLEIKMALATFFKQFTVAVCDQTPKKLTFWMSSGPGAVKSPIILKVSKR